MIALVYDTTSSNTGHKAGAVTLIEKQLGRTILKLPCRRHIHELHIKHVALAASKRPSTGVGDNLFKKFSSSWDTLKDKIDYNNLSKFDWSKYSGTKIEAKAEEVLRWAKEVLAKDSFPRSDYLELTQLIVVYLGGVVENFKIHKPKKVSPARFVQRCLYYIVMQLLSNHDLAFDCDELEEIEIVSEFCSIFYGYWFLRCPTTAAAPLNDLKAIQDMKNFLEIQGKEEMDEACL